jgi:predicted metal-dependent enzyme (double-stranded beta helix superfamily)
VFLLVITVVCFLTNVVFFFEDEHLLIILVVFLFWLSLTLVKNATDGVIVANQIEILKRLVKQQLIRGFLQNETEKVFTRLVLLVDEVARVTVEMVALAPTLFCVELDYEMQLNVINNINDVLVSIAKEVEKNQEVVFVEFTTDFLATFVLDDEE